MELKTLEDFENKWVSYPLFFALDRERVKFDLRQEAIKQAKELQRNGEDYERNTRTIQWIKHFFNITEEELK